MAHNKWKVSRFLERVQISILDMKSEPSNGFSYIGHAEDLYTKFCVLFPLKDDSPVEIAQCLKKYFISYFGPPVSFVSDSKESCLPEVLCEVLECWKGDGLSFTLSDNTKNESETMQLKKSEIVEKFIRDNISMMTGEYSEDSSWSDWLPEIMLRLNVARHTSFHRNPYSAVFRQKTSALLSAEHDLRLDCDGSDVGVEEMPDIPKEDLRKKYNLRISDEGESSQIKQNRLKKTFHRDSVSKMAQSELNSSPSTNVTNADTVSASVMGRNKVKQERCDSEHDVIYREHLPVNTSKENKAMGWSSADSNDRLSVKGKASGIVDVNSQNKTSQEDEDQDVIIKLEPVDDDGEELESSSDGGESESITKRKSPGKKSTGAVTPTYHSPDEFRTSEHRTNRSAMQKNAGSEQNSNRELYGKSQDASTPSRALEVGELGASSGIPDNMDEKQTSSDEDSSWGDVSMEDSIYSQPCIEIDYAEDSESCESGSETNETAVNIDEKKSDPLQFFEIKRKLSLSDHTFIERLREEEPTLTLSDIKERLLLERNVKVHISTISRAIKRMTAFQESIYENAVSDYSTDNTAGYPIENTEGMVLPVVISPDQNQPVSSSFDEVEGEVDKTELLMNVDHSKTTGSCPRLNFNSQDDSFLKYLLNIKPLLTVDEIKERLQKERGLVVSSHSLRRKIANTLYATECASANKKQKLGTVNLPVSEVSPSELGMLVYRNLQSKRRSYIVKGNPAVYSPSREPSKEVQESSGSNRRQHVKRNVASTPVREDTESSGEDMLQVHFGEENSPGFRQTELSFKHQTDVDSKLNTPDTQQTERDYRESHVIELSESTETEDPPKVPRKSCDFLESGALKVADLVFLKKLKEENPLITLKELKHRLQTDRNIDVHIQCVSRAMTKVFMSKDSYNEANEYGDANASLYTDKITDDFSETDVDDPTAERLSELYEKYNDNTEYLCSGEDEGRKHTNKALRLSLSSSSPTHAAHESGMVQEDPDSITEDIHDSTTSDGSRRLEKPEANVNKKLSLRDLQYIRWLKDSNPNLTLRQMKVILKREIQLDIHLSTISRALKKAKSAKIQKAAKKKGNGVIDLT